MNLTVAYRGRSGVVPDEAGGLSVRLATNLRRDRVSFDAAIRDPLRFREAIGAFFESIDGDPPEPRMPSDPILTVGPDALVFEGFRADGSCYAALTIDREAFEGERDVSPGTTTVDPPGSCRLLGSDRPARLVVNPSDFGAYREERLDLPAPWLRGFLRLQEAMSLPTRRVPLDRQALYNLLAFLRRHRAARGPRAVRFDLEPGRPASIVLEPWGQEVAVHDRPDPAPRSASIRAWGRDRLGPLARLLPLMDGAEVHLLGTGLPSFWTARIGPIRLTLGLPGPEAETPAPPVNPGRFAASRVAASFRDAPAQSLAGVAERSGLPEPEALACLHRLAGLGQVAPDPAAALYRWREVVAGPLPDDRVGPEDPEAVAARQIAATASVVVDADETRPDGRRAIQGRILDRPISLVLDPDGRLVRGRCTCSHHLAGGLRRGPCRHLRALRTRATRRPGPPDLAGWLASLRS